MPTINHNYQVWNRDHSWSKDGDEWNDQADFCGQPYPAWKQALIDGLLLPYITADSHVLEIGPGHGRWTSLYIDKVKRVSLVDLSPTCIEHCRKLFQAFDHVDYFVNDGASLRHVPDHTIDVIWSYDVFVHIERAETQRYFSEFARVLKDGGTAVIHHPNARRSLFSLSTLLVNFSGPLRTFLTERLFKRYGNMGRSLVTSRTIRSLAKRNGLQTVRQTDSWGAKEEYNCRKFADEITVLRKASLASSR